MNLYEWSDRPSLTAFPVSKAGLPYIYVSAFATAVVALLGLKVPAVILLLVTLFICFFFRDPDRVIPTREGAVVSPADGRVITAARIEKSPFFDQPCFKISIFMSIFNVHVNRVIHDGQITNIIYFPGKFHAADKDSAGLENEYNAVLLKTESGKEMAFVQVAGLVARRIICAVQKGDIVKKGQRFGLICFGSRLDIYLPEDFISEVSVGDKVKSGNSILGQLA